MRQFKDLFPVYADPCADSRMHGVARGLKQLFKISQFEDLPAEMSDIVARLDDPDEAAEDDH